MKFPINFVLYLVRIKLFQDLKISFRIQVTEKEKIQYIQNKKFEILIDHAKKNVPYYTEILKEVKDINDLRRIPFLTKSTIKERFHDLKATNLPESDFEKNSTSGSTGESMYFYSDRNDNYSTACLIRGDMLTGWKYGEKSLIVWGALRDINAHLSFKAKINKKFIQKYKILSSFNLSDSHIDDYINIINKFRPSILIGYPTGLFLIAQYILKFNKKITAVKGIISAGENLYDFQREIIEKAFEQKVFNRYGSREVKHIASECTAHNGLHICTDHVIVEIINENGEPANPGENGEIVLTDLDNFVFPMIRYKIGDIGVLKNSNFVCSCGVTLPMLEKVEGRTMDIIIGMNGNRVTGTFWTLFFKHKFNGIVKFQVIQDVLDELSIYFEIDKFYNTADEIKIKKEIFELLGYEMKIQIFIVDEIKKTITGKHRWIISNVSPYV